VGTASTLTRPQRREQETRVNDRRNQGSNRSGGTALAVVEPPRMPMPVEAKARDLDETKWRALVDAVFPSAETPGAILLAVDYCKARRLDPFKRAVHIVPMYNSKLARTVETVWPGIGELRTTASRTGVWAGNDDCMFGRTIEQEFNQSRRGSGQRGPYENSASCKMRFPEWAQFTVYKIVAGVRVPFVGPKVFFVETFSGQKGLRVPNERWQQSPRQMLEKCAEAAALRRAFPEELSGEFTADEMEGQVVRADVDPAVAKYHYQNAEDAAGGADDESVEVVDEGDRGHAADQQQDHGQEAGGFDDLNGWAADRLDDYMRNMRRFFGRVGTLDALDDAMESEKGTLATLPTASFEEAKRLEAEARARLDRPIEQQDQQQPDDRDSAPPAEQQREDPPRDEPAYVRNLRLRLDEVTTIDALDDVVRAEKRTMDELPAWVARLAQAAIDGKRTDLQVD
jgi:phage recombination protein Bet